jgi:hypothetical protein
MGYKENAREVKRYGLAKEQISPSDPYDTRYPTAKGMATRKELQWKNYN